ncbi:hypothetical protein BASA81_010973 [Batrachochytrium salamandrivorans]|nr:hypothetical protein BASA81_010973 [Batrachochytrium salamandrivorans]
MDSFLAAAATINSSNPDPAQITAAYAQATAALEDFIKCNNSVMAMVASGVATESSKALWVETLLHSLTTTSTTIPTTTTTSTTTSTTTAAESSVHNNCVAWPPSVTALALQAMRILSRERVGCEAIYTQEVMDMLAKYSTLDRPNPTVASTQFQNDIVVMEALKCLSNVLLQDAHIRSLFATSSYIATISVYIGIPSLSIGVVFLLSRLVFLGTVGNKAATEIAIQSGVCDSMAYHLNNINSKTLICTPSEKWITETAATNEILKAAFNLSVPVSQLSGGNGLPTLFGGPRSATDAVAASDDSHRDELGQSFKALLRASIDVFIHTPATSASISPPHSHAINMMMNMPVTSLAETWFPCRDYTVVRTSVAMLSSTLMDVFPRKDVAVDEKDNVPDDHLAMIDGTDVDQALPPILILMRSWARGDEGARAVLKELLMPDDIDRSKPLGQGTTVTNYMIWLMTSVTMLQIRDCVSELLYAICKENVSDLVAYVGYGHAAGFLMNSGMLGSVPPSQPVASEHSKDTSQLNEEINPITGEYRRENDGRSKELDNMSEEEREREAEKLMVLINRLEKTGVIQVVQKGDDAKK